MILILSLLLIIGSTSHTSKVISPPTPQDLITHSSTGKRRNKNTHQCNIKHKKLVWG